MSCRLEFCVDTLEPRQMLAASVDFNSASGLLRVSGDGGRNAIDIDGTGPAGSVEVLDNNVSIAEFVGVRRISVSLGTGDDLLRLRRVAISGSVIVNMGSGADVLVVNTSTSGADFGPSYFGGNFVVNMGFNDGDYMVEVYAYTAGIPFRPHKLFAVYKQYDGDHILHRHAKYAFEQSSKVSPVLVQREYIPAAAMTDR